MGIISRSENIGKSPIPPLAEADDVIPFLEEFHVKTVRKIRASQFTSR